jgi:alkanesulfonate monooxygenase SsuD/methylene tetrahydromethanopterin reductase-like flavin-dependent oxidoreductase (luciferase family)
MFALFMRQDGWVTRFCLSDGIQGRVIFGMRRRYQTCQVETFSAFLLGPEADRTPFEEQCAILMQAFDGEAFSHHGKHYRLAPDVTYRG